MRPLRLHLDNFGSFREPVTVDFADVDYFALVGPTGAGKSTIIDAICFALYGTVPRWGKENVIAHALAPSATSGKVALVFETSGRRHAVVRSLRRDAKATVHTKEARLDELDPGVPATAELAEMLEAVVRPVAEGGDDVTAEVQRITGLEYKFFTQCVVLPQGKFAEFLHARPRERQDLLVQLLDAEVYERIQKRAGREEDMARQAAIFARDQLAKLSDADEAAERAAAARLGSLRDLVGRVRTDLDLLRVRDQEAQRLREERDAMAGRLGALAALAMPDDVPTLADTLRDALSESADLTTEVARTEAEEQQAEDALAALDDPAALTAELAALDQYERMTGELEAAEAESAEAESRLAPLAGRRDGAEAALAESERDRDRLRDVHASAELARRLVVGEACPTCLRPVTELPEHAVSADLETAERNVQAAKKEAEEARTRQQRAEAESAHLTRRVQELRDLVAGLESPAGTSRAEIERRLATVRTAESRTAHARQAAREARTRLAQARQRSEELRGKGEQSWRDLEASRDTVVSFGAPPLDRDDLHLAWTGLLAWRDGVAARERAALDAQDDKIAQAQRLRDQERAALATRLADHDVAVPPEATPERIGEIVVAAVAQAESRLERVKENQRLAGELEEQAKSKEQEARVAHELALRLRADAFERWLCSEALELLVATASGTLRDLSDGQYELAVSPRSDIEVIDYAEAGMRRSARTLSGGETFQAALALALALSSQVAGLSAAAARSLDSIFLDEGFGTLDPATLDTVATTLERLATGGERMVGVVTHVPALADRVPVRFEITRDAKGSHLRKAAQ
ncbi:SMC family ATPase [Planotetraspora sp. A-T 1434]|uniref:AAA family ATPase n=1 Tax=Planotetraspora sp. A-T 1434 TaxID=2979219 RepID=UPI0021C15E68|nr:SMC family ATPase [Planotetraspora sp. A-T 1434]MCT9934563.1 SMC family ATPase [Planotetraspora sp. A-T 1434]